MKIKMPKFRDKFYWHKHFCIIPRRINEFEIVWFGFCSRLKKYNPNFMYPFDPEFVYEYRDIKHYNYMSCN